MKLRLMSALVVGLSLMASNGFSDSGVNRPEEQIYSKPKMPSTEMLNPLEEQRKQDCFESSNDYLMLRNALLQTKESVNGNPQLVKAASFMCGCFQQGYEIQPVDSVAVSVALLSCH